MSDGERVNQPAVENPAPVPSPKDRALSVPMTAALAGRLALAAVALCAVLMGIGFALKSADSWTRTDGALDRWFEAHRQAGWNQITLIGSDAAKTSTVMVVAAVSIVVLRIWLGRWHESLVLAIALAGEVLIFLAVTAIVQRPRPDVDRLDQAPPTSSFPSGHTAAAVVVYGFLALVIWRYVENRIVAAVAAALLVAMPVFVAMSRIYRGAHYPTDVIAGAVLSLVWLSFVVRTLMPKEPKADAPRVG